MTLLPLTPFRCHIAVCQGRGGGGISSIRPPERHSVARHGVNTLSPPPRQGALPRLPPKGFVSVILIRSLGFRSMPCHVP